MQLEIFVQCLLPAVVPGLSFRILNAAMGSGASADARSRMQNAARYSELFNIVQDLSEPFQEISEACYASLSSLQPASQNFLTNSLFRSRLCATNPSISFLIPPYQTRIGCNGDMGSPGEICCAIYMNSG